MPKEPEWGGRPLTLHEVLREEDLYFQKRQPHFVSPEWGFTPDEVLAPDALVARLLSDSALSPGDLEQRRKSDMHPVVVWLRDHEAIKSALASLPESGDPRPLLGEGLNAILSSPQSIYDRDRFTGLNLAADVLDLAELGPTGRDLIYLNRRLLEAPFQEELRPVDESHLAALWDRLARDPSGRSALCLSGGGIRSATFALGVLQGFARTGLLGEFDYLSTVSGGGYIGSWLTAWIKRRTRLGVLGELSDPAGSRIDPEHDPIRHLRNYTNYLTPRTGSMSADTWTIVVTYVRNTLLNWVVFLPLLVLLVLGPRVAVMLVRPADQGLSEGLILWLVTLAAACAVIAVAYVHSTRPSLVERGRPHLFLLRHQDRKSFVWLCLVPIFIAAFLLTGAFSQLAAGGKPLETLASLSPWFQAVAEPRLMLPAIGAACHLLGWAVSLLVLRRYRPAETTTDLAAKVCGPKVAPFLAGLAEFLAIIVTGAVVGYLAYLLLDALSTANPDPLHVLAYTSFGPLILLTLLLLAGMLFTGLTSRVLDDADREWGARFGGMTFAAALAWGLWSALVIYGPVAFVSGKKIAAAVASLGGLSGLLSILGGKSALTRPVDPAEDRKKGARRPAPPLGLLAGIFIAVLVVLTSYGVNELVLLWSKAIGDPGSLAGGWDPAEWRTGLASSRPDLVQLFVVRFAPVLDLMRASTGAMLAIGGIIVALAVATWVIDVNQFSLHAMYRARLIRAYLGASRKPAERSPNPFTGFDENDNLGMRTLVEDVSPGPVRLFHVINVTLNEVQTDRLSWQSRKAASFTFSPLHAGSWSVAYRRIGGKTLDKRYGGDNGISLGTAAAISGAAASPNMGYHSSPIVTLLMTLFNARLGWWLGNPGTAGNSSWNKPRATGGARLIVDEALGKTSARRSFVYLSDGGHFDNLGLYEMVLRRCRLIVAIDASADPNFYFADLGVAIRNIRIDLGVPIELVTKSIQKPGGTEGKYWAIGIINYAEVTRGAKPGVLVYIKPTLYDREPADVLAYHASSPRFPHEPTTDQWFSESQFESYRSLGAHISERTVAELSQFIVVAAKRNDTTEKASLRALIDFMAKRPTAAPPATAGP